MIQILRWGFGNLSGDAFIEQMEALYPCGHKVIMVRSIMVPTKCATCRMEAS